MNKHSYLVALKRGLSGLPSDQVADIVRDYEQHFTDAMERGRSDQETARALGDPRKIALEFKAMVHLDAFQNKRSLANFWRMAFTLVCMAGFNIFLLPFMLLAPLMLLTLYLASACCFVGGATIAASGLLGIDKIAFKHEARHMALVVVKESDHARATQTESGFHTGLYGIHLVEEPLTGERIGALGDAPSARGIKLLNGAIYVAIGFVLFVLSQKLARYLGMGARRYLTANANMLRGAHKPGRGQAFSEAARE